MYKKRLSAWYGAIASAILAFHFAHAQEAKQYVNHKHTLAIGDTVPDFTLRFSEPYGRTAKLSDFRGKLVIFDFWGKNCASCINAFPKMEALQKTFGEKLQIIMVTKDDSSTIANLAARSPLVRNLQLPSIVGDTVITRLMEYQSLPTHAWIDGNRVLRHFTVGLNTSAESITRFLNGDELQFGVSQERGDFDWQAPLLTEGGGRMLKHMEYYSLITGKIAYNGSSFSRKAQDNGHGGATIKFLNMPMVSLYLAAFGHSLESYSSSVKRVIVEADDADLYRPRRYGIDRDVDEWRAGNLFCYEAAVPLEKKQKLFVMMQNDLENFFGFTAKIEKRTVNGMAIVRVDSSEALYRDGEPRNILLMRSNRTMGTHHYAGLSFLVGELQHYYPDYIAVDKTGIDDGLPIHLEINAPVNNQKEFRKALQRYGLDLIEGEMEVDMLILRRME